VGAAASFLGLQAEMKRREKTISKTPKAWLFFWIAWDIGVILLYPGMRYNCRMVAPDTKAAFLIQLHCMHHPYLKLKGCILLIPVSKEKN
jgi:hypothetical protein